MKLPWFRSCYSSEPPTQLRDKRKLGALLNKKFQETHDVIAVKFTQIEATHDKNKLAERKQDTETLPSEIKTTPEPIMKGLILVRQ